MKEEGEAKRGSEFVLEMRDTSLRVIEGKRE